MDKNRVKDEAVDASKSWLSFMFTGAAVGGLAFCVYASKIDCEQQFQADQKDGSFGKIVEFVDAKACDVQTGYDAATNTLTPS